MSTWRCRRFARCSTETGTSPDEIDLVLYAGALTSSSTMECAPAPAGSVLQMRDLMDFFKYPVSRLQSELDLANASVAGIDQQGCAAIFSAVRLARATLLAEPDVRTVLCVSADRLAARRLARGRLQSRVRRRVRDAPASRRGAQSHRRHPSGDERRVLGFGLARERDHCRILSDGAHRHRGRRYAKAGVTLDDDPWVIPHNVSLRSWEILLGPHRLSAREAVQREHRPCRVTRSRPTTSSTSAMRPTPGSFAKAICCSCSRSATD